MRCRAIIFLILVLTAEGCEKGLFNRNEVYEGRVVVYSTDRTLEGVWVKLYYSESLLTAVQTYSYTDSCRTDGAGRFRFDPPKKLDDGSVVISAESDGYFSPGRITYDLLISQGSEYYLFRETPMIIRIKNINPFDENDELGFLLEEWDLNHIIRLEGTTGEPVSFKGMNVDTVITVYGYGGGNYELRSHLTRNNSTDYFSGDYFRCSMDTLTEIRIHY